MKKVVLIIGAMLFHIAIYAQSLEFGIGGGISTNTSPGGNMVYKGDQSLLNYSGTLKVIYTNRANWQFGVDGHLLELSSKSSVKYGGYWNEELYIPSVGGDDKKLVYAKYTMSLCALANKKFAFSNSGGVYIGAAFGYGFARNNSKKFYSNESYKGADGGLGLVYGMQLGYVKDFSDKIAFNLEAAMRYYDFKFGNAEAPQRPPHEKLHYSVIAFPITIGFRFYLHKVDESLIGTYNVRRNRYYFQK